MHPVGALEIGCSLAVPLLAQATGPARQCFVAATRNTKPKSCHGRASAGAAGVPAYVQRNAAAGVSECVVCLGQWKVEEGEVAKRLPACLHVFHQHCIDPVVPQRSAARRHARCAGLPVRRFAPLPAEMV
ncbi:unnamed protein product [Urochloa humidicola]